VAVVAGIDEAGYGPMLGPLVVSAATFELPDELKNVCLWELLTDSICRRPSRKRRRLSICDSKKLYRRADDLIFLERAVLAILYAGTGRLPKDLHQLLQTIAPELALQRLQYRWYNHENPTLPVTTTADDVRVAGQSVKRDLRDCNIKLTGLWAAPLLEEQFNQKVGQTRSKAAVLMGQTLTLMQKIIQAGKGQHVCIHVDRQGGRVNYQRILLRAFSRYSLTVEHETSHCSSYRLELPSRPHPLRIRFLQSGEDHHLPIALASMVSKYLRELFMRCYNAFWRSHKPDLAPTAGYYTDARRFLQDIQPVIRLLGIDPSRLIRCR